MKWEVRSGHCFWSFASHDLDRHFTISIYRCEKPPLRSSSLAVYSKVGMLSQHAHQNRVGDYYMLALFMSVLEILDKVFFAHACNP